MIKVLLVTSEPPLEPRNGIGRYVKDLKTTISGELEIKVMSLMLDPHFPIILPENRIQMQPAPWVDWSLRIDYDWFTESPEGRMWNSAHKVYPFVKVILNDFKPDIIYLQSIKVWLPFRYENNVIIAFHGLSRVINEKLALDAYTAAIQRIEHEALIKAQSVVVFSQWMKKKLIDTYPTPQSIAVLPIGVSKNFYFTGEKPKDIINVAFFGRINNSEKGCHSFLEAAHGIKSNGKYPEVHFHLYGEGEDNDPADFPEVQFHGHVEGDDLIKAYQETHIVVVPSRQEPFGLVGLEAMAAGCLLLCPRGLGMDEYVSFGENAVEIESSAESIKQVLERMLENFEAYKDVIKSGISTAASWDWEETILEHCSLFNEIKNHLVEVAKSKHLD